MQVGLLPGDTDFMSNTLTQVGLPPGDTDFMSNTPTHIGSPLGDTDFTSNTLMQVGSPEVNTVSDPMMQLVPDGGVGGVEAIEEPKVAVPLAEAFVTSAASPAPVKRGQKCGNHRVATGTDEMKELSHARKCKAIPQQEVSKKRKTNSDVPTSHTSVW